MENLCLKVTSLCLKVEGLKVHSYVIIDFICGAVSDTGKADARRGKVRRR